MQVSLNNQLTFNSRPHKEVDVADSASKKPQIIFQFTTSQGGRPSQWDHPECREIFQFTTSQGGRLTRRSTRSHSGRSQNRHFLSIHDLTRRSTALRFLRFLMGNLSIHDLTRRSTILNPYYQALGIFQFTTSQGGRLHVPKSQDTIGAFQFTTSQGGRQVKQVEANPLQFFQFTTSQGGRPGCILYSMTRLSTFNSRPHKEVDNFLIRCWSPSTPFNSRPHKEVDVLSRVRKTI